MIKKPYLFLTRTTGATAIEYALIAALIAIAIAAALPFVGTALVERFNTVVNAFN